MALGLAGAAGVAPADERPLAEVEGEAITRDEVERALGAHGLASPVPQR